MIIRKQSGFTLIELMIVVIIIGVLAGIAYPSYRNYTQKARRTDGKDALTQIAASQEQFYARCLRYSATLAGNSALACDDIQIGLGRPTTSPEGHYSLSLPSTSVTFFNARATAIGLQTQDDPACQTLELNSFGQKSASACW